MLWPYRVELGRIAGFQPADDAGQPERTLNETSPPYPGLKTFLQRWAVTTLAVLVAANVVPGIDYDTTTALLLASLLLGALNAFVRPLLLLLSLPLLVMTLGLFLVFINAALLYLVGSLVKSFHVETFGSAFWGALVISLVSLVFNALFGIRGGHVRIHRGPPRPPGSTGRKLDRGDDGGGPVIDV